MGQTITPRPLHFQLSSKCHAFLYDLKINNLSFAVSCKYGMLLNISILQYKINFVYPLCLPQPPARQGYYTEFRKEAQSFTTCPAWAGEKKMF